jgi:hypothetical protein
MKKLLLLSAYSRELSYRSEEERGKGEDADVGRRITLNDSYRNRVWQFGMHSVLSRKNLMADFRENGDEIWDFIKCWWGIY